MNRFTNKVIYQIYPKSFCDSNNDGIGDIQGIISKLDYLCELGVDYIWLSPIMKSPQRDNGYDISDYYLIDEMFGTNEDYETLIYEAKLRGLKIIMDLVLNHTSTFHSWFQKALKGDTKYQNYYVFRDEPTKLDSVFGGNAWEYNEEVGKYYLHMFDVTQADLNWESKELRHELYDMINYWIDKGVEGFRLDVIDMIGKNIDTGEINRTPRFYELLAELQKASFSDKILTVGECWFASLKQAEAMCNEKGLTQVFHFHDTSITNCDSKWNQKALDLNALKEILETWDNDYRGINAWVLGNHDSPRRISLWLDDDKYRKECAKLILTMYALLSGNIYIYQGDEIGMNNAYIENIDEYNDVETLNYYHEMSLTDMHESEILEKIKVVSRDNARVPLAWSSDTYGGFSTTKPWLKMARDYQEVNVENDLNSNDSVYRYFQKIINFRKRNNDLLIKKSTYLIQDKLMIIDKENYRVVLNFAAETNVFNLDSYEVVLSNYLEYEVNKVRPYECLLLKRK